MHAQLCQILLFFTLQCNIGASDVSFLLHIVCPFKDVDLVLDEMKSYAAVRQRDRLNDLITNAIVATLVDNGIGKRRHALDLCRTSQLRRNDIPEEDSVVPTENETEASNLLYRSTRIVSGQEMKHKPVQGGKGSVESRHMSSPFSDAFSQSNKRPNVNSTSASLDITFDEAFMLNDELPLLSSSVLAESKPPGRSDPSKESDSNGLTWTRSRLKGLDTDIRNLTAGSRSDRPIKISKDMLSTAQFVAQLDAKFILVNMDGILCAVDQHAADERIGLERLESALQSSISSSKCGNDQNFFDLSKMKNINVSNLIKSIPVKDTKPFALSPTQAATIAANEHVLGKWKFDFDVDGDNQLLTLKSVPGICDKVATQKDLMQFIQALGNRTSDASLVKPAFIKRVLASYACRYAIMFGDVLTEDRCKELIASLAQCDLSFICAHGRPSVVPLVDMNVSVDESLRMNNTDAVGENNDFIPLRFQSRRNGKRRRCS